MNSDVSAKPVSCLICEHTVEWSEWHPHGAVIFTTSGNYGSATFDSMHAEAVIAICDLCMKARGDGIVIRKPLPHALQEYRRVGDLHDYLAGAE